MWNKLTRILVPAVVALAAICAVSLLAPAHKPSNTAAEAKSQACPNDDTGLTLPPGCGATIFAEGIGHARHMVASPRGAPYVNTWTGRYYGNDTLPAGGFRVALQAQTGPGTADG